MPVLWQAYWLDGWGPPGPIGITVTETGNGHRLTTTNTVVSTAILAATSSQVSVPVSLVSDSAKPELSNVVVVDVQVTGNTPAPHDSGITLPAQVTTDQAAATSTLTASDT